MVKILKDKKMWDDCLTEAAKGGKTVIVDFTATWCGPCKMIGPKFEEFSQKYTNLIFVKVDVDENDEVAASCGIQAMPTFQVYQNGKKVRDFCGASPDKLQALCEEFNK